MDPDEQAIRAVIETWLRAAAAGDVSQIHNLMCEDMVFLQPGQAVIRGREVFITGLRTALAQVQIEGRADIQEIRVLGDHAYCWNQLTITKTPHAGGEPTQLSGPVLTIFRKESDGRWRLFRDANMLT